jgi:hypothetical protein
VHVDTRVAVLKPPHVGAVRLIVIVPAEDAPRGPKLDTLIDTFCVPESVEEAEHEASVRPQLEKFELMKKLAFLTL